MSQLLNHLHHHQLTKPPNAHYHPSQASLEECQTASKQRNKNRNRKVRKLIGRIRIELTSEKDRHRSLTTDPAVPVNMDPHHPYLPEEHFLQHPQCNQILALAMDGNPPLPIQILVIPSPRRQTITLATPPSQQSITWSRTPNDSMSQLYPDESRCQRSQCPITRAPLMGVMEEVL